MMHKYLKGVEAVIFDLDGVLVDTAVYHYQAWQKLAAGLQFSFTLAHNEELKGVSRVDSLKKILKWANVDCSAAEFQSLMDQKNNDYLAMVQQMRPAELLPGTLEFLQFLKDQHIKIALGSASKNALLILEKMGLKDYFDVIIDGNAVQRSKPDPEVFLLAAQRLAIAPAACLVFEDAQAGVEAALHAGMAVIGVIAKSQLSGCTAYVQDLSEMCKS